MKWSEDRKHLQFSLEINYGKAHRIFTCECSSNRIRTSMWWQCNITSLNGGVVSTQTLRNWPYTVYANRMRLRFCNQRPRWNRIEYLTLHSSVNIIMYSYDCKFQTLCRLRLSHLVVAFMRTLREKGIFHGVLCGSRPYFHSEWTVSYTLDERSCSTVCDPRCLGQRTKSTFPSTRCTQNILQCAIWDAYLDQDGEWNFPHTICTKKADLYCELRDACLG
jgi:hypothetical protein